MKESDFILPSCTYFLGFLIRTVTSQGFRENIHLSRKTWKCQGNCADFRKYQGNVGKNILLVNNGIKCSLFFIIPE